ncbi:ATP-grasp domain-containing protein [Peribacillus glennii]|uniref:hypothetical protein n=1 Tax=Peribacillus glennii TaxID=2303991 RepID=UPI00389A53CF
MVRFFKEVINEGVIHIANSSNNSTAMQYADKCVVTSLIYDRSYIPFLLKYCHQNGINAIILFFDIDLPILAKNKKVIKFFI